MARVYPHPSYQQFTGFRLLFEHGLPAMWLLADGLVLRTEYDFRRLAQEGPILEMCSCEERAAVIGVERVEIKTDNELEEGDLVVCTLVSGEVWQIMELPDGRVLEQFLNSNVDLFETFLRARDNLRSGRQSYESVRAMMFESEPSLALRSSSKAMWREFLDECDVEYDFKCDEGPHDARG